MASAAEDAGGPDGNKKGCAIFKTHCFAAASAFASLVACGGVRDFLMCMGPSELRKNGAALGPNTGGGKSICPFLSVKIFRMNGLYVLN